MATRFSVPCFIMLSGAFVLHNEKTADYKYFFKKSFVKIVIPFLLVYGMWCIAYGVKALFMHDVSHYIAMLFKGTYGNLWFMPMLIGIYCVSPLIVRLKEDKQIPPIIGIVLLVWAVVSQSTSDYVLPYSIGVVGSYLAYFIVGNILYERRIKLSPHICVIGIMVVLAVTTWWRCEGHQFYAIEYYRAFFSPLIVLLSILVFMLVKEIRFSNNNKKITWLSEKTYYVYLLHTPILIIVNKLFNDFSISELGKILVVTILVVILSFLAATLFERILKQILGKTIKTI